MTLRHRIFLVYLIVVVLIVATVGASVYELVHSRRIFVRLMYWNEINLLVQQLKTAFEREAVNEWSQAELKALLGEGLPEKPSASGLRDIEKGSTYPLELPPGEQGGITREGQNRKDFYVVYPPPPPPDMNFPDRLVATRNRLNEANVFALVRWQMNVVYEHYENWRAMAPAERNAEVPSIRRQLDKLTNFVVAELQQVQNEANLQDLRTRTILNIVIILTAIHVLVIGSLLRRWLLRPMEQLNRQVESLAHDQPPSEPLLAAPREMANLAEALDRARKSLGELRQQLIESERMTTIGQLAAQLAHNLRNPLASIRAVAQIAGRHDPSDGAIRARMEEIVVSIDRMNRWIAGLMEIARREPTPTTRRDVVPVLNRVCEAVKADLAAKELALEIVAPHTGLECMHDPETLEHALIAMLVNAMEASPLGGKILIKVETISREGAAGSICRISIRDHGSGLPPDDPDRIFEFSYSTKQHGMGLGLGLARLALRRQGGSAHAHNNPDGGATVYVELPIGNTA